MNKMKNGFVSTLDHSNLTAFVENMWQAEIIPSLVEYIRIPNKSPAFEPDWESLPHMNDAVELLSDWASKKVSQLDGATFEVLRSRGRTPVILIDVPGIGEETTLIYGHLDKQPEMEGWSEGKTPWEPVIEDDKLYGRGGADDGYAIYSAITALLALQEQNVPHSRIVILIEASEESGSPDLPFYMEQLSDKLKNTSLVVCLDSGCGDYERLWLTTSLRGLVGGELRVDVLTEGVHSGDASGVVPSSMRIIRQLLDRIEDSDTGEVLVPELSDKIPEDRREQAITAVAALGETVFQKFPFVENMQPTQTDLTELVLNRTWRPALSVTGFDGAPPSAVAGSVQRPYTSIKLSMRLPPSVNAEIAEKSLKEALTSCPPYDAKVTYSPDPSGTGWNSTSFAPWLRAAAEKASTEAWGKPAAMMGEGGTIPFMWMLGEEFPDAQFAVMGVLGPNSNAHGPNEFLHIPTGKRITETVCYILEAHAQNLK